MGIEMTLKDDLIIYGFRLKNDRLHGLKYIKEFIEDITEIKNYYDEVPNKLGDMSLKRAKILGDALEISPLDTAQQVIGFSIREIPEPSGYMAVMFKSEISQIVAYYALHDESLILHKVNGVFYVGKYFRFKKEVDIECEEILKL